MSDDRNFYVIEIMPNKDVYDLHWDIYDVRKNLDSNHIYVICYFDLDNVFIWIGKEINNLEQIEFAKTYASKIKSHALEEADINLNIYEEYEGNESTLFKESFNIEGDKPLRYEGDQQKGKKINISEIISPAAKDILNNYFKIFKNKSKEELLKMVDQVKVPEGVKFSEYVLYCDKYFPFGKDKLGRAYLFPQTSEVAHRMDLKFIQERDNKGRIIKEYGEDWTGLRRSGIGWKLNPTIYIALFFFLPTMIISPILYTIYNRPDLIPEVMLIEVLGNIPFFLVALYLVKLINYCFKSFDELLKPYGNKSYSFRVLWKDDLEYLKFESSFFEKTYNNTWMIFGLIIFIIFLASGFQSYYLRPENYHPVQNAIPKWTRWFTLFNSIGIGLVIFLTVTFLFATIKGLFTLAQLSRDRTNLSIWGYKEMIDNINYKLNLVQTEKVSLIDNQFQFRFRGKTFYEFQRGNRRIGELLFNIASYLVLLSIIGGVALFFFTNVGIIEKYFELSSGWLYIAVTTMGISSFLLFIFPQINLHRFLRNFKYELIDKFSEMKSRFEFIYYDCLVHPEFLSTINPTWNSLNDIQNMLDLSDTMINEIKKYGTWSYDFPEIIKVVGVALSTFIPIVLQLITI
ncbi:MAG: hypothetical protein ACTSVC_15660 [Promethearchaeota archaeon]